MSKQKNEAESTQSETQETIIEEIIYDDGTGNNAGCRGCLYAISGGVGCFVILVVLIVGAIAVAGSAVEDAFDSLLNVVQGENRTRNITIPVVERLQNLQELNTTRYNFSNIIESSVEMPPLLAGLYGENIIMIAVGHIEAGIDLSQVTRDDITVEDGTLMITLPPPQILSCFLDEQQTDIVERNRGVFAPANVEIDDAARTFALRQFLSMALEDGILTTAAEQAESTLQQFLGLVVDSDSNLTITVNFKEVDGVVALPNSCPS